MVVPIAEKEYNIFGGRFYNSVFYLSISRSVLTIYAIVPNMCFDKNCDKMGCYPTYIVLFFRYMTTTEIQVTWVRENNFLLIITISNSIDRLTLQCIPPTCILTGTKRADVSGRLHSIDKEWRMMGLLFITGIGQQPGSIP